MDETLDFGAPRIAAREHGQHIGEARRLQADDVIADNNARCGAAVRAQKGNELHRKCLLGILGCRGLLNFAGLLNLAAADAGCAYPNVLGCALDQRVHILQIQIPTALGYVVCVADPVAELRPASAHFTYFRHNRRSLE